MIIDSTKSLLKLLNRVCEAIEVSGLLEGHDETLMVTDCSDDLLPLLDQWRGTVIGQVVGCCELCGVAPDSQLIDGLANSDFTLCLVAQLLDILALLDHLRH